MVGLRRFELSAYAKASAFAKASAYAKAPADETADKTADKQWKFGRAEKI